MVVRHRSEIGRRSNTGRLVVEVLPDARLVEHGTGPPTELGDLGPDAWVLAPGAVPPRSPPRVATLVVLDGTWSQVKGMRWRIPPLPSLPTLSLPAPAVAPRRVRRSDVPERLATIEAVAAAFEMLGETEHAVLLRARFEELVEEMRRLRGFEMPAKGRSSK